MIRQRIALVVVFLLAVVAIPVAQTPTYLVSGRVSSISVPLPGATV